MESTFRYDFSFPPKSSAFNNSNTSHHNQHHNAAAAASSQNRNSYSNHHTVHQQQQLYAVANGKGGANGGQYANGSEQTPQNGVHQTTTTSDAQLPPVLGLSKSASTSFLLNCVPGSTNNAANHNINNNTCFHNNNNINNNNNNKDQINQNFCTSCNSTATSIKNSLRANEAVTVINNNHVNLPQTPKDSDCSFTFDELKNTLAFMEDSPLVTGGRNGSSVSGSGSSNSSNSSSNTTTNSNANNINSSAVTTTSTTMVDVVPAATMIMIPPSSSSTTAAAISTDCASGSSSSSTSSSSLISSGSTSASSSVSSGNDSQQQQLAAPSMPKSNSNPMLLSIASTSTSSTTTTTSNNHRNHTVISSYNLGKSDCSCPPPTNDQSASNANANNNYVQHHHQHQQQQQQQYNNTFSNEASKHHGYTGTAIDLLIKKSSPPKFVNSEHVGNATNNNYHNNNNLLTTHHKQHQQQQQQPQQQFNNGNINTAVECAAKKYRCAAQVSEATCCWKGKLPPKQYKTPLVYSTKVFVGGLPWDITEEDIVKEFGIFGPCRVEWTNKEKYNLLGAASANAANNGGGDSSQYGNNGYQNNNNSFRNFRSMSNLQGNGGNGGKHYSQNGGGNNNGGNGGNGCDMMNGSSKQRSSPGFAYVIYDHEYSVRSLVGNCIEDYQNGRDRVEYYFKISTRRVRNKEVQIIPWILADNNFALCTPKDLDPKKTVFVGNLHGTMTARDLAHIMNELFGCVVYAGIDIDKLKYPIGSGRVTFSHQQNFMRAVRAAFVDLQSSKFSKRIQIDPYLEDVTCCLCYGDKGMYFCRDFECFNYYCGNCWEKQHSFSQQMGTHKPLMRKREDK